MSIAKKRSEASYARREVWGMGSNKRKREALKAYNRAIRRANKYACWFYLRWME